MSARGIIPAFDKLEAGDASIDLGCELSSIQKLTFEGGKEAFAHGIVVTIPDRPHRRADAHSFTAHLEGHGCALRTLVEMINHCPSLLKSPPA